MNEQDCLVRTLGLVGVGMIGASIGLAAKRAGLVRQVLGCARSAKTVREAQARGAVDAAASLQEIAAQADLIVVAVPMLAYEEVFAAMAPHLRADACMTDAGSTKRLAVEVAHRHLGAHARRFVAAHPIAGSERSGPQAARADLFVDRPCVLTPVQCEPWALRSVEGFWRALGARIAVLDPDTHDRLFARVSHLPHLAAYALVNAIVSLAGNEEPFAFAGAGFRDFTRIASSSPEMWRDIAIANADALTEALDRLRMELDAMREAVAARDAARLEAMFRHAKQARDAWLATQGERRA